MLSLRWPGGPSLCCIGLLSLSPLYVHIHACCRACGASMAGIPKRKLSKDRAGGEDTSGDDRAGRGTDEASFEREDRRPRAERAAGGNKACVARETSDREQARMKKGRTSGGTGGNTLRARFSAQGTRARGACNEATLLLLLPAALALKIDIKETNSRRKEETYSRKFGRLRSSKSIRSRRSGGNSAARTNSAGAASRGQRDGRRRRRARSRGRRRACSRAGRGRTRNDRRNDRGGRRPSRRGDDGRTRGSASRWEKNRRRTAKSGRSVQ